MLGANISGKQVGTFSCTQSFTIGHAPILGAISFSSKSPYTVSGTWMFIVEQLKPDQYYQHSGSTEGCIFEKML